jgi:hypothetical protein
MSGDKIGKADPPLTFRFAQQKAGRGFPNLHP